MSMALSIILAITWGLIIAGLVVVSMLFNRHTDAAVDRAEKLKHDIDEQIRRDRERTRF